MTLDRLVGRYAKPLAFALSLSVASGCASFLTRKDYKSAEELYHRGDYSQALPYINNALEKKPDDEKYLTLQTQIKKGLAEKFYSVADFHYQQRDLTKAMKMLNEAISLDSSSEKYQGMIEKVLSENNEAEKFLSQAQIYLEQKNDDSAIQSIVKALSINKTHKESLTTLASITDQYHSRSVYDTLASDSQWYEVLRKAGSISIAFPFLPTNYEDGITHYKNLAQNGIKSDELVELGQKSFENKHYYVAINTFEEALKYNANNKQATSLLRTAKFDLATQRYNSAESNSKKGDLEKALEEYLEAKSLVQGYEGIDLKIAKTKSNLAENCFLKSQDYEDKNKNAAALFSLLRIKELGLWDQREEQQLNNIRDKIVRSATYSLGIFPFRNFSMDSGIAVELQSRVMSLLLENKPLALHLLERDELEAIIKEKSLNVITESTSPNIPGADIVITGVIPAFMITSSQSTEMKTVSYKSGVNKIPNQNYYQAQMEYEQARQNYLVVKQNYDSAQNKAGLKILGGGLLGLMGQNADAGVQNLAGGLFLDGVSSSVKTDLTSNLGAAESEFKKAEAKLKSTPQYLEEDVFSTHSYPRVTHIKKGELKVNFRIIDPRTGEIFESEEIRETTQNMDIYVEGFSPAGIPYDPLTLKQDFELREELVSKTAGSLATSLEELISQYTNKLFLSARANKDKENLDLALGDLVKYMSASPSVSGSDVEEFKSVIKSNYGLDISASDLIGIFNSTLGKESIPII